MLDAAVLLALAAVAAGLTAGLDSVLLARTHAGTDNALRLAAILTYVGVDASYTLARALGLTALVFSYLAVVAGLLASVRRAGGRDPGRVTGLVHRQAGLITLVLVAGHAAVPYTSAYSPYGGWTTALVPFRQPVSWGVKAATGASGRRWPGPGPGRRGGAGRGGRPAGADHPGGCRSGGRRDAAVTGRPGRAPVGSCGCPD